ncbi:MAG: hypothetical protein NDI60_02390 [Elusimicrobiales bacterium]|nr:hypothetical protein [Elusimicrobiales bacterium]
MKLKKSFAAMLGAAAVLAVVQGAFAQAAPRPDSLLAGVAALGGALPGGELPAVTLPGRPAMARAFQPAAGRPADNSRPGQSLPAADGRAANPENSLAGKWTGWGEWTYQGSGTRCDVMWLIFEDKKDHLERKDGYFDCGFVGLASEPARWTKQGPLLLDQNGAEAGSYEKGTVVLKEAYSENVDILTTIKVSGLHFDYSEIWTEKSGRELYVITGRMFTGGR